MGNFKPVDNLDQIVAKMIQGEVARIVRETEAEAKRQAPPTKTWHTAMDAHVRRTHRTMNGEVLPNNLRFKVQAYQWDVEHPGALPVERNMKGGHQSRDAPIAPGAFNYMIAPRDGAASGLVQVVSCRCRIELDPLGVAKMVGSTSVTVRGTTVSGTVYAEGEHVIGAEYGDVYPGGLIAEGTRFMRNTVIAMGNRA